MRLSNHFIFVIMLACVVALNAAPACAAPKTLKFSISMPAGSAEDKSIREHFVKYLEDKYGDLFKVEAYSGASLGGTDTIVQGVNIGTVHLSTESTSNLVPYAPEFAVFDLPFAYTPAELITLMETDFGNKLKEAARDSGVQVVTFNYTTPRNLISTKPVHTAEDLQGLKTRATNSKWHIFSLDAMKLRPVPIATNEMLTALQQGMVDSLDIGISAMWGYNVYDIAKYISLLNALQICSTIYCGSDWWDSLTPQERAALDDAGRNFREAMSRSVEEATANFLKMLADKGCEIYEFPDEERDKVRKNVMNAMQTLPAEVRDTYTQMRSAIDNANKK